eukprot:TRINITY_DN15993_c0_g3_i1.p1 TRINITY_DN15993_c0_g3~~TRINITY_DN15993_c0_g3_i1.p1  ORF type:complete len:470 (+),score=50.17 TRINITY_DN15993_c0_g3_i1:52-1461(+)
MADPYASGRSLAAALREGRVTSVEATKHFINRIEALDRDTNLVVVKTYEQALQRAALADAAKARGELWGPLHGVPMTIKESFALEGVPLTCGMQVFTTLDAGKPYKPKENAAAVQRLLDAGAVIIGKTNLPTEAADVQSYNPIYGTSRNPWNINHTPGGSSGGSAGALACGFTLLELGTDIGGSIRTPAHFCGVCGHKPTQGLIDKTGKCPPSPFTLFENDLSVAGPMARNCEDLAMLMNILVGPSQRRALGGWSFKLLHARVTEISKLKVAVWADDKYCPVDAEYAAMIRDTAASLARAGATVDYSARPNLSFQKSNDVYKEILKQYTSDGVPAAKYQNERLKLKDTWEQFWSAGPFDVMLCPVTPGAAIKIDESGGLAGISKRKMQVNGVDRTYMDLFKWAGLTILADLPVTVLPIGISASGLPVGVQVVAREYHDLQSIEVGKMLERVHSGAKVVTPPRFSPKASL